MNGPITTLIGNLTADPELRYTPNGVAVANFTIAVNISRYDKQQGQSVEAGTLYHRCSVWRDMAENVAESLARGSRVVAHVQARPNEYQTKDGEKRTSVEYDVVAIGPDLRYATAKVAKTQRSGGQQDGGWSHNLGRRQQEEAGGQGRPSQGGWGQSDPASDPWATQGQGGQEPPW